MRNRYQIPHPVRMRVIWLVRDYDRMKTEYDSTIDESPAPSDGQPKGTVVGKPTEAIGLKRAEKEKYIRVIEEVLKSIPKEYQAGVWNNIVYRTRYPQDAAEATYRRWKAVFIYTIAEKLTWI